MSSENRGPDALGAAHSEVPAPRHDKVGDLLKRVGRRPEIAPDVRARVELSVRSAWQAQARRRQRVMRWSYAVAAVFALAVVLVGLQTTVLVGNEPVSALIRVDRVEGVAWVVGPQGRSALRDGQTLAVGTTIEVARGGLLALRSETHDALRLDEGSRLRLESTRDLMIERGAVYVDNEASGHAYERGWSIRTPLIDARDIGTRFLVRHGATGSMVGVRDGLVLVSHAGEHRIGAGERLEVEPDGRSRRLADPGHGPDWDWVIKAAVPPDLRGRPVIDFLRWYARESGLQLNVAPGDQLAARLHAPLQGSTADLGADQWLEIAQLAANFRVERSEAGELHVHDQE